MAVYSGKGLVVKFGSDTLTHVRSASVSSTGDTVEITAAGDTFHKYIPTISVFEMSVEMLADDTADLFDTELVVGTEAALIVNPEGIGAGAVKYSGTGILTSVQFSSSYSDVAAVSLSFTGNSALTVGVNP